MNARKLSELENSGQRSVRPDVLKKNMVWQKKKVVEGGPGMHFWSLWATQNCSHYKNGAVHCNCVTWCVKGGNSFRRKLVPIR